MTQSQTGMYLYFLGACWPVFCGTSTPVSDTCAAQAGTISAIDIPRARPATQIGAQQDGWNYQCFEDQLLRAWLPPHRVVGLLPVAKIPPTRAPRDHAMLPPRVPPLEEDARPPRERPATPPPPKPLTVRTCTGLRSTSSTWFRTSMTTTSGQSMKQCRRKLRSEAPTISEIMAFTRSTTSMPPYPREKARGKQRQREREKPPQIQKLGGETGSMALAITMFMGAIPPCTSPGLRCRMTPSRWTPQGWVLVAKAAIDERGAVAQSQCSQSRTTAQPFHTASQ